MRISRGVSFRVKQISKKSLFITATSFFALASLIVSNAALQPVQQANAAATPESCFQFDSATGTILNYYDNENNDAAQPACPRDVQIPSAISGVTVTAIGANDWSTNLSFSNKHLTSVIFSEPSNITEIGMSAFSYNQLTSLTIPNSVTTIGDSAFSTNEITSVPSYFSSPSITAIPSGILRDNKLTSLTIPSNIVTIGGGAFEDNQLTNVTIPSSVVTIEESAFGQNLLTEVVIPNSVTTIGFGAFAMNKISSLHLGNSVESIGTEAFARNHVTSVVIPGSVTSIGNWAFRMQSSFGPAFTSEIYSGDPARKQAALDSVWYVRLITADPLNPHGFVDDINLMGSDNWGGHLVNPAGTTTKYLDTQDNELKSGETVTGKIPDGATLHNYVVAQGPAIPPLVYDPDTGEYTPESIQAKKTAPYAYTRAGAEKTFTPPAISGYITPAAQTKTLTAGDNTITFIYQPESTGTPVTSVPFNQHAVSGGSLTPSTTPASIAAHLIKASTLAISNTDGAAPTDCSTIQSANLLAPNTITSPDQQVTILGGLDFTLTCTPGAETKVHYTLGSTVSDTTKLRIYKHSTKANKTEDITKLTTISNINGKTVISYHLIDGGTMDEDGQVNGEIVDPVYVGLENTASELAETGVGITPIVAAASIASALGAATFIYRASRARQNV